MAINHSEQAIHVTDKDGQVVCVLPGGDIPAGVKVENPYVTGGLAEASDAAGGDGPPPRAGKGSGEDKWRAYADAQGLDVSDLEGRDEIIAALEAEGIPVE